MMPTYAAQSIAVQQSLRFTATWHPPMQIQTRLKTRWIVHVRQRLRIVHRMFHSHAVVQYSLQVCQISNAL